MKKQIKDKNKRSIPVTIVSSILGSVILVFVILLLPLTDLAEVISFVVGVLLVILAAITAIMGRKGGVAELIYSMTFWN